MHAPHHRNRKCVRLHDAIFTSLAPRLVLEAQSLECGEVLFPREDHTSAELLRRIVHNHEGEVAFRQSDEALLVRTHRRKTLVQCPVVLAECINADSVRMQSRYAPVRLDQYGGSIGRGIVQMIPLTGGAKCHNHQESQHLPCFHLLPPFFEDIIHTRDTESLVGITPLVLFACQG